MPDTVGNYLVLDNLKFSMFHPDWTAKEELFLIQGIMKCGMGNWIDISDLYVKTKTDKECEPHYFTFFYKNKENCMASEDDCLFT